MNFIPLGEEPLVQATFLTVLIVGLAFIVFTGLIQTTGTLRTITPDSLQIAWNHTAPKILVQDMAIGDSMAVDGICLTVTQILADSFWAAVSPETSQRTILGYLQPNALVNLEASLRVGSKIGGHFVTGHIDGIGYLHSSTPTANAWMMKFLVSDRRVSRYIVPKGSVAVNGVSLTVADCETDGSWFTVAVIPLTYAETNLHWLETNSPVNVEGDVLGKYVEKFVRMDIGGQEESMTSLALDAFGQMNLAAPLGHGDRPSVTTDFLAEHGYN